MYVRLNPRPEVLSLLGAVKDRPEDDAPRLRLADWLAGQGAAADVARAEFVRLQCRSAGLPTADPRRTDLLRVRSEVLEAADAALRDAGLDLAVPPPAAQAASPKR
jgi:uncharacterized protein (TIGR02996 family)